MRFGCKDFSLEDRPWPLVIAEVGVNHNGDPATARAMVDAARAAGADVVKFQSFRSAKEISRHASLAQYQKACAADGGQLELCSALELSPETLRGLCAYCNSIDMPYLIAAFESDSLHFLVSDLGLDTVKIPSGEVTNLPLLREAGQTGASIILSTGASTLWEVGCAVEVLQQSGCQDIMLFHCVSEYPAPPDQVNLRAMSAMAHAFGLPVGFSDHTIGTAAAVAAAALGAAAVEKHFTLGRNQTGPDHKASIEPHELAELVQGVRLAGMALGNGRKEPQPCEQANRDLIRKSLVAGRSLAAGETLEASMIEIKRPAAGIAPGDLDKVVGRSLRRAVEADAPLAWDDLA